MICIGKTKCTSEKGLLHRYDALNLLSCMRISTLLSIIKIHFARCWIMQETLEMQPKKVSRERPIGRRSILQIQSLGILCHVSVGHACYTTLASCTNDTTVHASYEGLGTNIWCCSASALCQTRDNNGKSRNPAFLPLPERGATG